METLRGGFWVVMVTGGVAKVTANPSTDKLTIYFGTLLNHTLTLPFFT